MGRIGVLYYTRYFFSINGNSNGNVLLIVYLQYTKYEIVWSIFWLFIKSYVGSV